MNISLNRAFVLAVAANVLGGFIVIAIMACRCRRKTGQWKLGDGW